jgi:hypothetical protein
MSRLSCLAWLSLCAAALLTGCDNLNRSMVFFTGTTFGVEIAVEPQTSTPAKLVLGYKRAEGLFDPVIEDCNGNTKTIKESPHSVLAKFTGSAEGGAANSSLSSWFASGRAAEILAANGAAGVLTDNSEIAASLSRLGGKLPTDESAVVSAFIGHVYTQLPGMKSSTAAVDHKANLDEFAKSLSYPELPGYSFQGSELRTENVDKVQAIDAQSDFNKVIARLATLRTSYAALVQAKHAGDKATLPNGITPSNIDSAINTYKKARDELDEAIRTDPRVVAAVDYFIRIQTNP